MAETVEDVLAEMEQELYRDSVAELAKRIRAALARERAALAAEYKKAISEGKIVAHFKPEPTVDVAAIRRVAEAMERRKSPSNQEQAAWAAALRKAVGR